MPTYPVTLNYYGYSMNYEYLSGTSMACPFVSGVAALAWSRYSNSTREFIRQWLRMTTDDLGDPGFDTYYGFGRVNARKAVEQTPPAHDLIAYEWKTPPYLKLGKTATITATVLNFGATDETNVQVQILANDSLVNSLTLGLLASGTKATISLIWQPTVEGLYNLTLYVTPVLGETSLDNNALIKSIFAGLPALAVVLHSYGNILGESIVNWQALTNEWYNFGNKMVYVDYTSLDKEGITYDEIAATEADVLIISCAAISYYGWQFTDSEIEAITRYVHEGHGLVATAGTFYAGVPNNNKLAPLFGLNQSTTWTATWTDLLHLLNTTHPFLKDVPNPLVFPQEQTALPYDGRWDSSELAGGKYLAMGHYQESAMVTYRGLIYISPWLEIIQPYYHHHLQLLYNAIIWSRYQKPAHEIVVRLEAPKYLQPGESTMLNATVENMGLNNETNVELNLLIDGAPVNSTLISQLNVGSSQQINYEWAPLDQRIFNLTAYSTSLPGEEETYNNVDTVLLFVRPTKYVLFDSSHDGDGDSLTGNYEVLNDLLTSNGFVVDELTTGPITSQLLANYDILILMDPEYDLYPSEIADIQNWVMGGGGVFAIPDGGYPRTMNTLLYPYGVMLTGWSGGYGITSDIANHNITQGVAQIYVDWTQETSVAFPSTSLAWTTDSGRRLTFLSALEDGGVVVLSDSNVMDNYGLGMADNARLMLNILNWLAFKPEHDLSLRLDAPLFLEPNASAVLSTTVFNSGSSNESSVQLELWVNGSIVDSAIIPELFVRQSFTLSFLWTPTQVGSYNVTAYVHPVLDEADLGNNAATKDIVVRPLKYVLFDQTHGTDLLGNYYVWVQSLVERGYIVNSLYAYPITLAALENYDVFIIPQAYNSYTSDELLAIQDYVYGSGGLLVIGDDNPYIYTDLTGFAGITWAYGGMGGITEDITPHPVTTGVRSVYLNSPSSILYTNGVAQGIVRDTEGNITKGSATQGNIMLAVSEQSSGKVIGFADEDTLRDYSIYEADNLLLADNMINWLSMPIQVDHELKVDLAVPTSLELDQQTSINITIENKGLSDETNVALYVLINDVIFNGTTLSELKAGESYSASLFWAPTGPAVYNVTFYVPAVAGEQNVANNIETGWTSIFYKRMYTTHRPLGNGTAMDWHADDGSWQRALPFDFPFYGVTHRTIYISSNGLITFLGPDADRVHGVSQLADKLAIAPAWYDWETYYPSDIYIWESGTYVGIRWEAKAYGSGVIANFEVTLSSEGVIQFNYDDFGGNPQATVGISNGAGHILAEEMLNIDYGNTIVFLPFSGKREITVSNINPSANEVSVGSPVDIAVVVENRGNFTENFELTTYAFLQNFSGSTSLMQATRVHLVPSECLFSTDLIPVGYRFNVTAKVEDVTDLAAWQIGLYFNGNILKAARWFEPTWDPEYVFYNKTTIKVADTGNGYIIAAASLLNPLTSFNGSGKLCIIELEVTAAPQPGETYSSLLNINNTDTFLLDSNNYEFPIFKENGYYELQTPAYPGHYTVGTLPVISLASGEKRTVIFTWSTIKALPGDYEIHAEATIVPCETDTQDNVCYDGIVTVNQSEALRHDIAVASVTGLPNFAYQGWVLRINVTVANLGNATESFSVTLHYNAIAVATKPVTNLDPGNTQTLTFDWNTTLVPCAFNCTIRASAGIIPGETDTTNNEFVAGQMDLKVLGDINGDGEVNMRDILVAVLIFRSHPGRADWTPEADLNRDGIVDMRDIVCAVMNFRKHI